MTKEIDKTLGWTGPNKAIVRQSKIDFVRTCLPEDSPRTFLTFPGACARFERMLIERKMASREDILGIQREDKTDSCDGKLILDSLLKLVARDCPFSIFGGNFYSFIRGYKPFISEVDSLPNGVDSLDDMVFLDKLGDKERQRFLRLVDFWGRFKNKPDRLIDKFSVVDDDTCCQFSREHFLTMSKLFEEETSVLSNRGILMINHQKGRERPGTVELVNKFLSVGGPLFKSVADKVFRYLLVPQVYAKLAWVNGVSLHLKHIIEYRDMKVLDGPGCGGVTMIQYMFTFDKEGTFEEISREPLQEVLSVEKEKKYGGKFYSKLID